MTARNACRIRVPDAIIYISVLTTSSLLVTCNTKDYDAKEPVVWIPYP